MVRNFIDPFLDYLVWVEDFHHRGRGDVHEVRDCILELRILKLFRWWFERWNEDECGEENMKNLKSMLHTMESTWEYLVDVLAETMDGFQEVKKLRETRIIIAQVFFSNPLKKIAEEEEEEVRKLTIDYEEYVKQEQDNDGSWLIDELAQYWNLWSSDFVGTIEQCKLNISAYSPELLHCKFNSRATPSADLIIPFLDAIFKNLRALVKCIADEVVPLEEEIETFEQKLMLMRAFFKLIPDDCVLEELRDLRTEIFNDINKVACLTFFFWAKAGDDDEVAAELILVLSDMSRKIVKPSVPDVASLYLGALKAMRLQQSEDAFLLGQAVPVFLDLLFQSLGISCHEDFEILQERLVILFTFLADPPEQCTEDEELILIRDQLGGFLHLGSGLFPLWDDTDKDTSEEEVHLREFFLMIERLKGKIRKLHNGIPDSFSNSFARINGLGFIDFLLQNLEEQLNSDNMWIPFAKNVVLKIKHELVALRPDLDDIFELQKEDKELQDTWLQLIDLAYLTEHAVNLCSVFLFPIWYNMVRLFDILDRIKVIKGKLDTVKHSNSYHAAVLHESAGFNGEIPSQAWYSGANEDLVGVEKEVDMIVDQLIRGPKSLEIVSIVGMGGSGKSTLARKVCNTQQVRSHFHIFAFCTVSQVYTARRLLLEILKDIKVTVDDINSKTDNDLAHLLHQQLSSRSYVVVMDDIWKIDAWEKVKSSLPDDNTGSRVIFTTREREVAIKAQRKFTPHSKNMLSDRESWELLQAIVFHQVGCPPNLFNVGQVIARNCGGLPLAIAVIGRLLARKERNLTLWNEISEKTSSFASEEGCMNVLELSYKHLPEPLKSCFLYLGVFAEDESIPTEKLMLVWIAEGFTQKSHMENTKTVAKEYLTELVDRNLLEVAKRSSNNGIKICRVHDIVRDFCQRKAQEENFFQLIHGATAASPSHSNRYRLCINTGYWKYFVDNELTAPGVKSLTCRGADCDSYCDGRESILSKFQIAQVLDLEKVWLQGPKNEVETIIESMTSLVHVRYLAVAIEYTNTCITSRMANLKNMETLIIQRSYPADHFWWSETFWRMEKLRHLDVGRCRLIPPHHFETYPPLYNLEYFSTLVLKPGTPKTLLEGLPNLRKLRCDLEPDSRDDLTLGLDVLSKLESLKLQSGDGANVIFPATLKKLSLNRFSVSFQLGILPHLEVLKIHGYWEERWDVEDGEFPHLKFLKLESYSLSEWNVPYDSFPRLEQLVLVNCEKLHDIPASFGESTTLKRIELHSSSSRLTNSANEIRDEQKDLGNDIELIIWNSYVSSEEEDEDEDEDE